MKRGLRRHSYNLMKFLAQLNVMDNQCDTRNVFKQRQDCIDGRSGTTIVGICVHSFLSSTEANCPSSTFRLVIPPSSGIGLLEKPMIKQDML
jgi:hypothetical protein